MRPGDDLVVRPGRIRQGGRAPSGRFLRAALAAAERAGGLARPPSRSSAFGRGRAASLYAAQARDASARGAVVKARVVRTGARQGGLALHLKYLQREGVGRDGAPGRLFDAAGEVAEPAAFADRCAEDRHHFRFIVSPDDAEQLADLRGYARDLMGQAEQDLGTRLDWIAIDHWNTGHPHLHILVRGRADDGTDLVISRDYISHGLRARAGALVQLELGPRSQREIAERLARQVAVDRWTDLDRDLARRGRADVIDLRPARGRDAAAAQIGIRRLRHLEGLGLATPEGVGRWRLAPDAETVLRRLGRESDIIARLHDALRAQGRPIDPSRLTLQAFEGVGRLTARGHDDELAGSAYAVIEGLDGGTHHVPLRDLADASDARLGAVVEARRTRRGRMVLAVRSDLPVERQVTARGATWLDRRLVGAGADGLAEHGYGGEVRAALAARAEHLAARGLARETDGGLRFARDLLATLRQRELAALTARLQQASGLAGSAAEPGERVAGVFRRRFDLASGRFAMIEGPNGFALAPWRPDLERHRDQVVTGAIGADGWVAWSPGRQPELRI